MRLQQLLASHVVMHVTQKCICSKLKPMTVLCLRCQLAEINVKIPELEGVITVCLPLKNSLYPGACGFIWFQQLNFQEHQ